MIGTVLGGRYEVTGLVNDGPVFAAYSARDKQNGRDWMVRVAKEPFARNPNLFQALKQIASEYGSIKSPLVEIVQDVQDEGTNLYYTSELSRGPTLAERIRKLAPYSIPVSVATAISICQGLEPLHRQRLAHGDLAPQNVVVLANGDVRLLLAGIWEIYSAIPTAASMVLPSMAPYLAPEISAGNMPHPGSDVYSLGVIIYELLAGRLPYYGQSVQALTSEHANAQVPSIRNLNGSVPVVLDEITKKAMAKNPGDRYANASELLLDLRAVQDALRFGRSLSWPLRPATSAPTATAVKQRSPQKAREVESVAPRMSAIRSEQEVQESTRKARKQRDVPIWMTMIILVLATAVLCMVGAWMLMNVNRPEQVPVPNLVGLTADEARAVLADSKLELKIGTRLTNEKIALNQVVTVSPPVGESVRQGSRVVINISAGSRYAAVPDLKGMTLDKAKSILDSLGLQAAAETIPRTDPTIDSGLIIESIPKAKAKVDRQSQIRLVVSIGAKGPDQDRPDGGYLYTVRVGLSDLTAVTQVKINMTDSSGTREIFNEERNPGDHIEVSSVGKDKEATFTIFYDDTQVAQKTQSAPGLPGPKK